MDLIKEYENNYDQKYDYYKALAATCQAQIEAKLEQGGVLAIVTSRAKRPDRLRAKLDLRQKKRGKPYASLQEIDKDLVDLAGVRVALYFPADRGKLDTYIRELFTVQLHKKFPEEEPDRKGPPQEPGSFSRRYSGYHATHYRVNLKEESLKKGDQRFAPGLIEIQVASLLMHAWSEANHDLDYKELSGKLSDVELAMLDQLNGLVLAGEISLETLQKARDNRLSGPPVKPFISPFELAAYLEGKDRPPDSSIDPTNRPPLGRVDLLFGLLQAAGMDQPAKLEELSREVKAGPADSSPIADRYIDAILIAHPELNEKYMNMKIAIGVRSPFAYGLEAAEGSNEAAMGRFLKRWGKTEGALHEVARLLKPGLVGPRWNYAEVFRVLEQSDIFKPHMPLLKDLFKIRNTIVHGDKPAGTEDLDRGSNDIEQFFQQLKREKLTDAARAIIESVKFN